ncbi:hypothetical protein U9M48_042385, partial [Paspalum notatum var. saurae]
MSSFNSLIAPIVGMILRLLFIRSTTQYASYLHSLEVSGKTNNNLEGVDEDHCYTDDKSDAVELKLELAALKHQLDSALAEIWNLKTQVLEMKQHLSCRKAS